MPLPRRVLVITHDVCDDPGAIRSELTRRGFSLETIATHEGATVPREMGDAAALVIMGGPFSVNDDRAHLRDARALVQVATRADLPVLGVCLGSQIVASALGARVAPIAAREIGWHEVTLVDAATDDPVFAKLPRAFSPFHWHGEGFDLPPRATLLARSSATKAQAFRIGRAYALQFHLESDARMIARMADAFAAELADERIDRARLDRETDERIAEQERLARAFFGAWVETIG